MANKDKDLVAALPGSTRGDNNHVGVTNHVLMPQSAKLPGNNPPPRQSSSVPAPELLGTGSKIPESQSSRMRAQFSSPDPAIYNPRKRRAVEESSSGSWTQDRPAAIGCAPYRSGAGDVKVDTKGKVISTQIAEKAQAEKAAIAVAREKANAKAQEKILRGTKEGLLSTLCSDPTATMYAPETQRIVNIVMDINKKLGLPVSNMGHWKLPDS